MAKARVCRFCAGAAGLVLVIGSPSATNSDAAQDESDEDELDAGLAHWPTALARMTLVAG